MRLLFLHGAGGFIDDGPLAAALGDAVGLTPDMPRLPDDDMSFEAWATPIREHLSHLDADDLVIAHSFGASILLRVLAEGSAQFPRAHQRARVALLAMPDWSDAGWDVSDYAFHGPEPEMILSLHHCRDDEVVPFAHLWLHASRLPAARVWEYRSGGHQFTGLANRIAADAGSRSGVARARVFDGPPAFVGGQAIRGPSRRTIRPTSARTRCVTPCQDLSPGPTLAG
ncbi:alpha/beta fold hydrolase [Granulicoccus sp. GXG6511]|uniref:alpha/beta fold hydrolase n=1 Tax=Granulicoccus sp. GXG6511 TaxID=3381351 RepID=UPI003D7E9789